MKACVFIGPTLTASEVRTLCPGAVCLPPVRQGDVYRVAANLRPEAIGIVDGYFSHVPSVWHKEILHALAQGIPVYGSASMGALRAAELAQFGMVGVGRIFAAYRDGRLAPYDDAFEDDDEVAVLHGPAELGYRALSEALVDVRATLARASEEEIVAQATRDRLVELGKGVFYQERSYETILRLGEGRVPGEEIEALRAWLPAGRIHQKRADAIAMLQALHGLERAAPDVDYIVAETTLWERARAAIDAEAQPSAPELDELRLQGAPYLAARARALERLLGPDRDPVADPSVPEAPASARFEGAEAKGPGGLADDRAGLPALLAAATRRRQRQVLAARLPAVLIERHILAELEASGGASALLRRVEVKRRALAETGLARPVPTDHLTAWHFRRLGAPVPADLEAYARDLDFPGLEAFHRSLLDDYLFSTASTASTASAAGRVARL